jgi:flagellar basal-body rod protein FlgC
VTAVSPATVSIFDPTAPFANSSGMVASPNVDLASEFVRLLAARLNYAANIAVITADAQMSASLLNITA